MADSASSPILQYMRRFEKTLADTCADMMDMRETIAAVDRRIEKRLDLVES
ncbi:MAG: hypothetical protein AAFY90_02300 [Pseudomonadota bacterium]